MLEKDIVSKLQEKFSQGIVSSVSFRDQFTVTVALEFIHSVVAFLKKSPELDMDSLNDLCGADYPKNASGRNAVVYHLYSNRLKHRIRLKTFLQETAEIDSMTDIYEVANWLEREAFDMVGIRFKNHPDQRRILLPEGWKGYPLKKEYPVFMPALAGKYHLDDSSDGKE